MVGIQNEIQCAVFRGTTKTVFVDKKTYSGPLYEQIESAYDFIIRNMKVSMGIKNTQRYDIYEFPPWAIRELICNAVCHRSLLEPSNIQISLFDDRLEIVSPGSAPRGLTISKIKEGRSKIRNSGIASVFNYLQLIKISCEWFQNLCLEEQEIIKVLYNDLKITQKRMAELLSWKLSKVKYYIGKLVKKGIIQREGTSQNGIWKVIK